MKRGSCNGPARPVKTRSVDDEPNLVQRLDHFNPDRSDLEVHALHVQETRSVDTVLGSIPKCRKMRVGNVQVRIDAKCRSKIAAAVRIIAAEEITIIEIPVCAGKGNRLWRLMDRIFIALGQHLPPSLVPVCVKFPEPTRQVWD